MPRPRKPYTQKETSRHGKTIWYFRRGKESRIRLPGAYGSPEFNAAYLKALAGQAFEVRTTRVSKQSLRWLVDQYYASHRFNKLAENSQRNTRLILEGVCKTGSKMDFRDITTEDVETGMFNREATPFMAIAYVSMLRKLFDFARDRRWIKTNPVTQDIKTPTVKSDGFHTWTVEDVERYRKKYAVGTQPRLAMELMLYSGLRTCDAIQVGRQHIKKGVLSFETTKTKIEVDIPVLPPLAQSINAVPATDLVFLLTPRGQKWPNPNRFSEWFGRCCKKALVPGRAHGLRKAGATIAAENGATPHQLMAMYGWTSIRMAEKYTKKANRKRLAEQAANKLYPHLEKGEGNDAEKLNENKELTFER